MKLAPTGRAIGFSAAFIGPPALAVILLRGSPFVEPWIWLPLPAGGLLVAACTPGPVWMKVVVALGYGLAMGLVLFVIRVRLVCAWHGSCL